MTADYERKCNERSDEFFNAKVDHPRFTKVLEDALFYLTKAPGTRIASIVGPSGVGKSRVVSQINDRVLELNRERMQVDREFVPFVYTEAQAYGHAQFSYKYLYEATLLALGDPFARLPSTHRARKLTEAHQPFGRRRLETEYVLRDRMQVELLRRGTLIWCIDEAQHTLQAKAGPTKHQLDVLKSIGQSGKAKLLTVGPPELMDKMLCSGQLARRSVTICFTRYRFSDKQDLASFAATADKLFKLMRFSSTPKAREHLDMLYAGSLGCIGVLKEWFQRAMDHAMARYTNLDEVHLTIDDLIKGEADEPTKAKLLDEIERMERAEDLVDHEEFIDRVISGSPSSKSATSKADASSTPSNASQLIDVGNLTKADIARLQQLMDAGILKPPPRARRTKPGNRNPGRDPTGIPKPRSAP